MPAPIDPTSPDSDGWVDNRPTLLIADDNAAVRTALQMQLGTDFNVVAAAGDSEAAIAMAGDFKPDVALIDVQMPGGGARVVVPGISRCSPATRMVMLSSDESRAGVLELLEAGAIAYLRKGTPSSEIAGALGRALTFQPGRVPAGGTRS